MATMVKEKRREKKKSKEKSSRSSIPRDLSPVTIEHPLFEEFVNIDENTSSCIESSKTVIIESDTNTSGLSEQIETTYSIKEIPDTRKDTQESSREHIILESKVNQESIAGTSLSGSKTENRINIQETKQFSESKVSTKEVLVSNVEGGYKELSKKLERIAIPNEVTETISEEREYELVHSDAYLCTNKQMVEEYPFEVVEDNTMPSAPCFEEIPEPVPYQEVVLDSKPKVKCMRLEDAMRLCGGKEIEEIKAMSEREEEIVEAGPLSGPEHPLVDLLSTFRSSLIAVERERIQLARGFLEEEKSRSTLWKVEKRHLNITEKCQCGLNVELKASYEHAELVRERMPIAKLRLEGLLRDAQDSYCHHQHAALLAYCQIEELISETIQSNKGLIREALSLILQALRLSDNAPEALASALQRWAAALSAALIDNRDLRQLLFLMHHLFRQSRSVLWASRVMYAHVDGASPWRVLAMLELLLARPRTDTALECIEDAEEAWEEVDKHGGGGAVGEGTLRERDLLALLHAFPLRDLVARLVLFTHSDIRHARAHEWGDSAGGRGVLRAACGVRALLHVLHAGARAHPGYYRLSHALRELAAQALHALACLHLTSRPFYTRELEDKITAELEAAFSAGFYLFDAQELERLPATLLADDTAKGYCIAIIVGLHDKSPKQLDMLPIELPVLSCDMRIRIVTQVAIDRTQDHELARIVLEFLIQTGLKRKSLTCKDLCDAAARECVGRLVVAHAYMHTLALHIVADLNMVETLEPSCVKKLQIDKWRPNCGEIRTLLDDWARRCQQLVQHLLLELSYTPYVGLPLDVQLTVGSWLCSWVQTLPSATVPEWCWSVLRRLRVHRTSWNMSLDAPAPEYQSTDLFGTAYALMATSWGHCIPLICSEGVSGLCKLACSRPRDAVQCLAGVMLVMAHSPESVTLTPKFTELFTTLLSSGPTLVQRALGRGGVSGAEMLLRLILAQLSDDTGAAAVPGVLCAWLHGAWRPQLAGAAPALLDAAACATRLWPHLDAYAASLLQEDNAKEHINHAIRHASTAPLLCECLLRACHAARSTHAHLYARLLSALHQQRAAGHKIHVDNALQKIGANITSEELVIYRTATAALAAPMNHPSHLTLWRLLLHLYLQTPPDYVSTPPVGPLFFSGLLKSRTLGQIKRRLQETITYHHNEAETLKSEHKSIDTTETQSTKREARTSPGIVDDSLLPALSIIDLTGESSASSDSEDSAEEGGSEKETSPNSEASEAKRNIYNLMLYHIAAEKLLSEYLCWLEEGEKVRAAPHHADIARFIPEPALEAAWKRAVSRPPPSPELDNFPLPTPRPPPDNTPPQTPFNIAVNTILKIKDRSRRRRRTGLIKSPVEDVDFRDARTLISLVDKHLKDIERLAQEWCTEVSRVSSLDGRLWELVSALRVRRSLPPVRKQCANNCKPITIYIPEQESCISVDAERGIRENRSSARAALRRLARARPHAARTAAALHSIARRTRSSEAGVRVVERAWRCAGAPHCESCAPASSVLNTLVSDLAERWICHDGRMCADLLSAWGKRANSALQQTLCGALLAPRRLPAPEWPRVYTALLDAQLPSHTVFSYLSKFEMSRWSESADATQRRDLLEALVRAVQRWGPAPGTEHSMLVELLGLHSAVLLHTRELCAHVVRCAQASLNNTLPPAHWTHVVRAVDAQAAAVPFDQLGHLLRQLGVMWWEARTGLKGSRSTQYSAYAPHLARLLHALQRAFVAAATRLSYEPERVAWYAWAALQEAWGAWVCPHAAAAPLLPSTAEHEHYTPMLRHFVDTVHQVMLDCPGSEVLLLQHIFEWCVQTYVNVQSSSNANTTGATSQESRVQASALLAELAKLPWSEHQWFYGKCLQQALQICTSTDRELTSWCCSAWRGTCAVTMLRDSDASQLAPRLASLLYMFTGTHLPHSQQMLDEACKLPWCRLPEPALDEALDRYFMIHHNPAQPYHDLPQFRIILLACELCVPDGTAVRVGVSAREKRARGISQWVRGACAPALAPHVPAHAARVLQTVTELAPHLEESEGEIEELLTRAVVIMCMEPAAAAALPVWLSWLPRAAPRLARASVSAAAALTVLEYFATLGDAAARALLTCNETHGWREIMSRWSSCPWREAHTLVQRGRVHAAYACLLTHAHAPQALRSTLSALLTADIHFVDNEPIIAVWICYACRIARLQTDQSDDAWECGATARALVARWAEQPRRSILRVVTMHADTDKPTALHRLLCRYAQCVLSPDDNTRRAYEASCTSTLGANNDAASWALAPQLNKLVRLAVRLWPKYQKYFQYELDMAPDETR